MDQTKNMETVPSTAKIAYFSMEIALGSSIPTYSGGLGILAGDMLRSAADLALPMVGVSLVHHKGYFHQRLDQHGNQSEEPDGWNPADKLKLTTAQVTVRIEERQVQLQAWQFDVRGISGHVVPVYLLDAKVGSNTAWDQELTDFLYGGDLHYRLCQEVILGLGGLAMLEALGHTGIETFHMNEGHAAMLTLGLLQEQLRRRNANIPDHDDIDAVSRRCVFTTHTPVPAGHDKFSINMARQVLGPVHSSILEAAWE